MNLVVFNSFSFLLDYAFVCGLNHHTLESFLFSWFEKKLRNYTTSSLSRFLPSLNSLLYLRSTMQLACWQASILWRCFLILRDVLYVFSHILTIRNIRRLRILSILEKNIFISFLNIVLFVFLFLLPSFPVIPFSLFSKFFRLEANRAAFDYPPLSIVYFPVPLHNN